MTPQELKSSILQLAIQGRLVEQRPEEGTGEELYRQIQAEKQRLIQAGKIKKEKPLPEISEDEVPFEIPGSWKWACFVELFDIGSAIRIHQSDWKTEGIPFLRGRELVRLAKTGNPDAEIFISRELYEKNREKGGVPEKGDLLVTAVGTLGKVYIVQGTYPFYYKDAYILRYNNFGNLYSPYFKYLIESPFIQEYIMQGSMGTTVAQLTIDKAKRMICPLPPLAEQKRIVAKIEELLPYLDRYEKAWNRLEDFNRRFPADMQKSILQMAIQGKLVEQRPEEGTGEELYRQIQAEKQALIKAGKIKKEKPLPEIAEDEVPFEIPGSWRWVRYSELMNSMSTGPFGSMLHKSDYVQDGIPLVNPANIVNGRIVASNKMMVSTETAKRLESYMLQTGMIIMGRRGEMGRCAVVGRLENGWLCGTGSFFMMPTCHMYVHYISMLFSTPYAKGYLSGASVGTTMNNLNHKILSDMPVPLPPLAEQKRIVARLEEILPLCERLK